MAGYLVDWMVWKLVEPRDERMAGEMVGSLERYLVALRGPLMDAYMAEVMAY